MVMSLLRSSERFQQMTEDLLEMQLAIIDPSARMTKIHAQTLVQKLQAYDEIAYRVKSVTWCENNRVILHYTAASESDLQSGIEDEESYTFVTKTWRPGHG